MRYFVKILSIMVLMGASGVIAQDHGPSQGATDPFLSQAVQGRMQLSEKDSLIAWQERVLLHVDKSTFGKDSPLFFKGYVLTGPRGVRATLSKVLKVELVRSADSVVVAKQYHKIENGTAEGTLILPERMPPGSYLLRAYTRWMQNYGSESYFTKELMLLKDVKGSGDKKNDVKKGFERAISKIDFFPEGGRLVGGLENRLLIKAVSNDGDYMGLEGVIVDGEGEQVIPVVSFENGIMAAYFNPDPGTKYIFRTNVGQEFELPEVIREGYVLNINNLDQEVLNMRVQATPAMIQRDIWVKGTVNGVTYISKKLELKERELTIELPKNGIPFGRMEISLVDAEGGVWTNRPVFIEPSNTLNIEVIPTSTSERTGERRFKLQVTNPDGTPVQTTLAFSATNLEEEGEPEQHPQLDFLWEMSGADFKGMNTVRADRFIRDMEVLTSVIPGAGGVRQFPDRIAYPFQQGLDLVGYAYDLNNKLLRNSEVKMMISTPDDLIIKELQTDASGRLSISNLQLTGETEIIFRSEGEDTSSRLVKVIPVQEEYDEKLRRRSVLAFAKQENLETIVSSPWEPLDSEDLIELNEVKVSKRKIERPRSMPPTYGMEAIKSRTVVQDLERPRFLFQLFAEIPGISITGGTADAPSISILSTSNNMGASPHNSSSVLDQPGPLWVIDGFVWGNSPGVDPAMGLDAWSIDRIEFFVGAEAAMYGSRAAKGVIMVYTRNGSDLEFVNRKEGRLYFQGYQESPDFDSYATVVAKRPRKFEDKATTVYWNPEIQTDENGEAIVHFNLPFETRKLKVKASAITPKGAIATSQQYFE